MKIQNVFCMYIFVLTLKSSLSKKEISQPYPKQIHDSKRKGPPYYGTIFVSSDIITPKDPTTFVNFTYKTQEERLVYDRRPSEWILLNLWIFDVKFQDFESPVEFLVNPEFTLTEASNHVSVYAVMIGQLGHALRERLQTVTIHNGNNDWGGGGNDILIHIQNEYGGIAEETLIHESCHTSLDYLYSADGTNWYKAAAADGTFISGYAEENPTREDIAESFLLYQAVRYRPCSLTFSDYTYVVNQIPNRIKYFDSLNLNMYPVVQSDDSCGYGIPPSPTSSSPTNLISSAPISLPSPSLSSSPTSSSPSVISSSPTLPWSLSPSQFSSTLFCNKVLRAIQKNLFRD